MSSPSHDVTFDPDSMTEIHKRLRTCLPVLFTNMYFGTAKHGETTLPRNFTENVSSRRVEPHTAFIVGS